LQFEKTGAQVRFFAEGENFTLKADRLHLSGVVYNLLDNALKYSPTAPQIQVSIGSRSLPDGSTELVLKVKDNGIGIPAEHQGRIFDNFFRVPTGNVHNVKGHGLGLSYAAGVVRQHGGRIEVQSEPGEGASFTLYFFEKTGRRA
jgi:signal transduction histidine kinase